MGIWVYLHKQGHLLGTKASVYLQRCFCICKIGSVMVSHISCSHISHISCSQGETSLGDSDLIRLEVISRNSLYKKSHLFAFLKTSCKIYGNDCGSVLLFECSLCWEFPSRLLNFSWTSYAQQQEGK